MPRTSKDPNKYPRGLNRRRVESIIAHYDAQSEPDAIAEADAAFENSRMTLVRVPNELVSQVQRLIAQKRTSRRAKPTSTRRRKVA